MRMVLFCDTVRISEFLYKRREPMDYSIIFVCLMGMGTVFFGLICLIALTYLMSAVVGRGKKAAPAPVPAAPQTAGEVTPELVAAVSAALAEELGTDITGIRIVSMKKV